MEQVSSLITQQLEAANAIYPHSKCRAISTLFIYVILEQGRQQQMANAISHALRALEPSTRLRKPGMWCLTSAMWYYIDPYTPMLFRGPNTPSMDSLIILLSPHIHWDDRYHSKGDVIRWAAAASAVPYTEKVGRDIMSVLLQILINSSLRPHIPIEIWTWLKNHSILPPLYQEWNIAISSDTLRYIRGLEDIKISKSFLLLAWSENNWFFEGHEDSMRDSLREDFCGIGMWGHRKDLIEQLDHILEGRPWRRAYSFRYGRLRKGLLELETEAVKTLIRTLPKLSFFYRYPDLRKWGCTQNHTPPSPVLCPSPAHDLSPHVANISLQCPVLVLPPIPSDFATSSFSQNCCAVVFGSGERIYHTFRDSSGDKPFFLFRL